MSKISVLITGTTGMVGRGVLLECLESDIIESITVINRKSIQISHKKLTEIIHQDLANIAELSDQLKNLDACFFCMGVSSIGMSESDYRRVTLDLTLSFAKTILELNPDLRFCYVSGTGTDSSEVGKQMWARVKGKAENELIRLFKSVTLFRPGFIQPSRGEKAKSTIVNAGYFLFKPLFPLLKLLFSKYVTSTAAIGKAMINAVLLGSNKQHLESNDINELADL